MRRQPFGGWKRSTVGGGAKPGGPGHVAQFTRVVDPTLDAETARRSFERAAADFVHAEHDPSGLAAESNVLRFRPLRRVAVRHHGAQAVERAVIEAAAAVLGVELLASTAEDESDREFAARCVAAGVDRVRLLCPVDDEALRVLHRADIVVDDTPPVGEGEVELRHWVREQSVSRTTHRHGRTIA